MATLDPTVLGSAVSPSIALSLWGVVVGALAAPAGGTAGVVGGAPKSVSYEPRNR